MNKCHLTCSSQNDKETPSAMGPIVSRYGDGSGDKSIQQWDEISEKYFDYRF